MLKHDDFELQFDEEKSVPVAFYRLTTEHTPQGSEELMNSLDFQSPGEINTSSFKIGDSPEKTYYCAYSKPAWYVEGNKDFKVIDLLVVADSEEEARNAFERKKHEAEEVRAFAEKWVEGALIPRLSEIPEIKAVVGRGDMFVEGRLPGENSDIDIMLLVDIVSTDAHALEKLKNELIDKFGLEKNITISTLSIPITSQGMKGGSEHVLIPANQEDATDQSHPTHVCFDMLSFPGMSALVENASSDKISALVGPYEAIALTHGKIFFDRTNGDLDKTIGLFAKKYARAHVLLK